MRRRIHACHMRRRIHGWLRNAKSVKRGLIYIAQRDLLRSKRGLQLLVIPEVCEREFGYSQVCKSVKKRHTNRLKSVKRDLQTDL